MTLGRGLGTRSEAKSDYVSIICTQPGGHAKDTCTHAYVWRYIHTSIHPCSIRPSRVGLQASEVLMVQPLLSVFSAWAWGGNKRIMTFTTPLRHHSVISPVASVHAAPYGRRQVTHISRDPASLTVCCNGSASAYRNHQVKKPRLDTRPPAV